MVCLFVKTQRLQNVTDDSDDSFEDYSTPDDMMTDTEPSFSLRPLSKVTALAKCLCLRLFSLNLKVNSKWLIHCTVYRQVRIKICDSFLHVVLC